MDPSLEGSHYFYPIYYKLECHHQCILDTHPLLYPMIGHYLSEVVKQCIECLPPPLSSSLIPPEIWRHYQDQELAIVQLSHP